MTRQAGLFLAAAVALAACGSDTDQVAGATALRGLAQGAAGAVRSGPAAPADGGITRAAVAALPVPADLITIESKGATGVVVLAGSNRGVETWASGDDKTVSVRDGILVATRGLGPDLIAAEVPPVSAVRAGGTWQRLHVTLDGLDRPQRSRFACMGGVVGRETITVLGLTYETTRTRESCEGENEAFVNDYWFDGSGKLRQSRQWAGPLLKHVAIRRLRE